MISEPFAPEIESDDNLEMCDAEEIFEEQIPNVFFFLFFFLQLKCRNDINLPNFINISYKLYSLYYKKIF